MIRGLSAFPITPSDEFGHVDTDALQNLLSRLTSAEVGSIGLLGSTGSYPYFTRAERKRAIDAAVECVGGKVPLLVGVGALLTSESVALTRDAQAAGATAGLLAPVSYAPLLDEEVFQHFQAVSEVGLPLCIYNNPATTHFNFSPELVGRLAELPNVVAVKSPAPIAAESAPSVQALRSRVPTGFSVGVSVDWHAGAALLAGADAWYSVLGGIYPIICKRLASAARRGDAEEVGRLNGQLEPVWQIFRTHSSFRVVHLAATLSGIRNAQPCRPVLPLSGDREAEVRAVLERAALH
jgi:4-hydroxy-tetrahydrodipicolinate synthase